MIFRFLSKSGFAQEAGVRPRIVDGGGVGIRADLRDMACYHGKSSIEYLINPGTN